MSESSRERYHRLRAAGLCPLCGKPAGPKSKTFCEKHRKQHNAYQRKTWGKTKARQEGRRYFDANAPTECECGRPSVGGRPCERCRFLDGETPAEAWIIHAMRMGDVCPRFFRKHRPEIRKRLRDSGRIRELMELDAHEDNDKATLRITLDTPREVRDAEE